jgi:hypothetical protein
MRALMPRNIGRALAVLWLLLRRPIGAGAVRPTVGFVLQRLCAAEEEIRAGGIADRPTASAAIQLEKRSPPRERDARIDERIVDVGLGIGDPGRG